MFPPIERCYVRRMTRRNLATPLFWIWRQFRRLPTILQWAFGAACLGSIAMSALVGDIGIAAMGTAIGVSGAMIGAVAGAAVAFGTWAASIVLSAKQQQR